MTYRLKPLCLDLKICQGADFDETFVLLDSNKNPINISGWQLYGQIRQWQNETALLIATWSSTANDGSCVITPLLGQFQLFIPASLTIDYIFTSPAYYDILALKPTGRTERFMMGRMFLSNGVSV